jgi:hypothetical protein
LASENVQAAACESVTAWPAIVSVPCRAAPALASTLTCTLPLPLPPDETAIHAAALLAVHAHDAVVVTVIGPTEPPAAGAESVVGFTEYEHCASAAAA